MKGLTRRMGHTRACVSQLLSRHVCPRGTRPPRLSRRETAFKVHWTDYDRPLNLSVTSDSAPADARDRRCANEPRCSISPSSWRGRRIQRLLCAEPCCRTVGNGNGAIATPQPVGPRRTCSAAQVRLAAARSLLVSHARGIGLRPGDASTRGRAGSGAAGRLRAALASTPPPSHAPRCSAVVRLSVRRVQLSPSRLQGRSANLG